MNNKVIFTCITGNYDALKSPSKKLPNFDYVCFTDNPDIKSDVWVIKPLPSYVRKLKCSDVKKQRCVKILPSIFLKEYDYSIWVDANVNIVGDLNELIANDCMGYDMCIPEHPTRDCLYDEYDACLALKKDTEENMLPQIQRYINNGYAKKRGLVQSNIIFRNHKAKEVTDICRDWWDEVFTYSHRDQLSFNYCLKRHSTLKFKYLDKTMYMSKYFRCDFKHGAKTDKNDATETLKKYINTYANTVGIELNFDNPTTLCDVINVLKIKYLTTGFTYPGSDIFTMREYCKKQLGNNICIQLNDSYKSYDEIDWNKISVPCVLKCNAGDSMTIVLSDKNKNTIRDTKSKIDKWFTENYALSSGLQLQYRNVDKRILLEKFLCDASQKEKFFRYSVWCFNGKPELVSVNDTNFYDTKGKLCPDIRLKGKDAISTSSPKSINIMVSYAEKLSQSIPFVVIDFYDIKNTVYLKGMRYTPYSGFFEFTKPEYNEKYGKMIKI